MRHKQWTGGLMLLPPTQTTIRQETQVLYWDKHNGLRLARQQGDTE